ncbi:hypothetical protein PINS_up013375 [Pythium insidiosum]|nr:hypothetical protein PINS_up013375 [Pythium insidiosum]
MDDTHQLSPRSLALMHVASCAFMQPLDMVKVRLQTQGAVKSYGGIWSCMRQVAAEQGTRALWRGAVPSLGVMVVSSQVSAVLASKPAQAGAQDLTIFLSPQYQSEALAAAIGSAVVRAKGSIVSQSLAIAYDISLSLLRRQVTTPLQVIKCRMQYDRPSLGAAHRTTLQCVQTILQESGPRGLFRGVLGRAMAHSVGAVGAALPLAATALAMPQYVGSDRQPVPAETLAVLSVATFGTGFGLMLPLDMLVTRLHAMPPPAGRAFQTLRAETRMVVSQHGLRGLFAGGMASLLAGGAAFTGGMLAFSIGALLEHGA